MQNQIPKTWRKVKLREIVKINMGQSPSSKHYNEKGKGLPFYQGVTDFGEKCPSKSIYCSKPIKRSTRGEILFSVRAPVGDVNIATEECCIGRGVASLAMKNGNNNFLYFFLSRYKEYFKRIAGGTTYESVNKSDLEETELPIPPENEQKRIASILSAFDDKIEVNNKIAKTLEQMAQTIFKEWFVLPSVALEKGGRLPKGWTLKKIKDLGKVVTGKTPSTKNPANFGKDCPFVTIPDMLNTFILNTERYLSKRGIERMKNLLLPKGSVCVSCIATVGLVGITTEESITNQQINSIIPRKKEYTYFLYQFFKRNKRLLEAYGAGGSTTLIINKTQFENLDILVADTPTIKKFHQLVNPMYEKILILSKENQKLAMMRDLFLPKLMKGEIRV